MGCEGQEAMERRGAGSALVTCFMEAISSCGAMYSMVYRRRVAGVRFPLTFHAKPPSQVS